MNEGKTFTTKLIPIATMDCSTCAPIIEKEIMKLKGVKEARANYITSIVKVTYDPDLVRLGDIEAAIERVGYRVAYKKYPSPAEKLRNLFKKEKLDTVQILSDADFATKILHSSKPAAVLFSSPTCPVCQILKKTYAEAAQGVKEQAEFYDMDITTTQTWRTYNVAVTPTILIFIDGQLKQTFTGLPSKSEIITALKKTA